MKIRNTHDTLPEGSCLRTRYMEATTVVPSGLSVKPDECCKALLEAGGSALQAGDRPLRGTG